MYHLCFDLEENMFVCIFRVTCHKKQQSMDMEEDEVPQGDVDSMEFSDASDR